jgi:hypothetical protein
MFVDVKQGTIYIVASMLLLIFSLGVVKPLFISLKGAYCFEQTSDGQSTPEKEAAEKKTSAKEKELSSKLFYIDFKSYFIAELRYTHSHPASCASSHSGFFTRPDLPPELI